MIQVIFHDLGRINCFLLPPRLPILEIRIVEIILIEDSRNLRTITTIAYTDTGQPCTRKPVFIQD
jgi:hypothetical protein